MIPQIWVLNYKQDMYWTGFFTVEKKKKYLKYIFGISVLYNLQLLLIS